MTEKTKAILVGIAFMVTFVACSLIEGYYIKEVDGTKYVVDTMMTMNADDDVIVKEIR